MAKRPEERFATAREFAAAVGHALSQATPRRALAPVGEELARGLPSAADGSRTRIAALAALAAAALAVGVAAGANSGSGTRTSASLHSHGPAQEARLSLSAAVPRVPSLVAPTTSTQPTTQAKPPPPRPDALEAQGHQLMEGGNYAAAIQVLRHAVAAAPPSTPVYAYALFDLGRSLRLAGDPRAAVPILWQRLQIPNQTAIVRAELALALRALGRQATGGAPPAPKKHHGHGDEPPPGGQGQGD
jgi:tetratricopeptide (TPR) repeat protein